MISYRFYFAIFFSSIFTCPYSYSQDSEEITFSVKKKIETVEKRAMYVYKKIVKNVTKNDTTYSVNIKMEGDTFLYSPSNSEFAKDSFETASKSYYTKRGDIFQLNYLDKNNSWLTLSSFSEKYNITTIDVACVLGFFDSRKAERHTTSKLLDSTTVITVNGIEQKCFKVICETNIKEQVALRIKGTKINFGSRRINFATLYYLRTKDLLPIKIHVTYPNKKKKNITESSLLNQSFYKEWFLYKSFE